jgi:phosphatidate cytidylyltransferase
MPFNLKVFKTRALSAIVFVIVVAAGLFANHWSFLILFSVVHFACWYEYICLVKRIDPGYKEATRIHTYCAMIAGWSFMLWMTNSAYSIGNYSLHELGYGLCLISIILLPVAELFFSRERMIKNIFHSIFGLVYISLSFALLVDIRNGMQSQSLELGLKMVCAVIAANWINDTMAYIVGSFIGKTPFSKISPKKTWEGTIGGFILAVAVGGFAFSSIHTANDLPAFHWFVIIGIAAVAGTIGDLFESKLKRLADVKDSGNMMPGHGGFLDRFDSLLFASTFCWLYIKLFL